MQRRFIIQGGALLLGGIAVGGPAIGLAAGKPALDVWKSPTCGCCHDWITHLQANGFAVTVHDVSESAKAAQRLKLGLADKFGSCHTALMDGYVVEGHVPAREITRLLKERPKAVGLAVPGMPVGSPGMDGPMYQGRKDAYAVLLVQKDGNASVYQSYR
jgi:hypothetical protein